MSEDPKEKAVFASYILRAFREDGKKYLTLQSEKDPKNYAFLFDEDDFS